VQQEGYPIDRQEAEKGIAVAIILTLVTCGIYGLFWQYRQMRTLNAWLGREEFSFAMWLLIGIITCGIYMIYIEYKMAKASNQVKEGQGKSADGNLPLICLLFSIFGLQIVSLAIQQDEINSFYAST